jgi:alcohol dehydrogenase
MIKPIFYRGVQAFLRALRPWIPFHFPEVIAAEGALLEVGGYCRAQGYRRVLMVSDATMVKLKHVERLGQALDRESVGWSLYAEVQANPSLHQVEAAYQLFKVFQPDAIVALGGGSAMDAAKALAAKAARPTRAMSQLRGLLRVRKATVPLIAIPTTAGTGSETTVAAVITDPERKEKYAISDPVLLPKLAVLDPKLLINLPQPLAAATGMDALTHAVEAYLNQGNSFETETLALEAVRLIHLHLRASIEDPMNLTHLKGMQKAAFLAGKAFTQAYVGYVHALAHGLGAFYNTPHGLANAVLLPEVLSAYGPVVDAKLAHLAQLTQAGADGRTFIEYVRKLNQHLGLPNQLVDLRREDLSALVDHAWREAHPMYPVPRFLSRAELWAVYERVMS